MGYNTTLMVLNDRWHEALNNPYLFVESIEEQMRRGGGEATFQTTVMRSEHAESFQLYAVQGNWMNHFWFPGDTEERLRPLLRDRIDQARLLLDHYEKNLPT